MFTLFTSPKTFRGKTKVNQYNAIGSWKALHPDIEIFLMGDDEGTSDAADEIGVKHIGGVRCNEFGTPLISSLFEEAQKRAHFDYLCYVNTDIILFKDLVSALGRVIKRKREFILSGQRWKIDLDRQLDFSLNWEEELVSFTKKDGYLDDISAMDYFLFPKGVWRNGIPDFAVGRPIWDSWLVYQCYLLRIPVINATKVVTAIHQNHDYTHVRGGRNNTFFGPEGDRNIQMAGGMKFAFTLSDATHVLTPTTLRPVCNLRYLKRRLVVIYHVLPGSCLTRFERFIKEALFYIFFLPRQSYFSTRDKISAHIRNYFDV